MYALPYLVFTRLHAMAINARRRDRSWRYLLYSSLAGLVAGLMLLLGIAFSAFLIVKGLWYLAIFIVLFAVVPPLAASLVRHVAVPFGLYKVAYYLGATFARSGKDGQAYGYCVAAWALSHRPSGDGEAWLAIHRDARTPLGDAEVVLTGLIAAGRGDADNARQLLRSTTMIVENHPAVRELAGEWLAVDAATRSAWSELQRTAESATFPATPLTWFLEGLAARHVDAPGAPGDVELFGRWLLAPYRRRTRALLEAVRTPVAPHVPAAEATDVPELTPEHPVLPRAVAAHLAIGLAEAPTKATLTAAVQAWDTALGDATTRVWLARRALELDAPLGSADRALRDVTAAVVDDLATIANAASLGAPDARGPVADALSRRLRHGRLDTLEAGFTRWAQRRADGSVRLAIDEWREFVALHAAYAAAVTAGGADLRRLAFPHAWSTGNKMAAWLWNARDEYPISHAISRWLLDEALAVGDTEAIELGHRNCALEIPTRLGRIRLS